MLIFIFNFVLQRQEDATFKASK